MHTSTAPTSQFPEKPLPNVHEPIRIEGILAALGETDRRAGVRAVEAVQGCEFVPTPELEQSVGEYYRDHYRLSALLGMAVEGQLAVEELAAAISSEGILTNYAMSHAADQIQEGCPRQELLMWADRAATEVLFREPSVGALTLSQKEINIVVALRKSIYEKGVAEGWIEERQGAERNYKAWKNNDYRWKPGMAREGQPVAEESATTESVQESFSHLQNVVVGETRHAGQLMFHATGNARPIIQTGELQSRSRQAARLGYFYAGTQVYFPDGSLHSNVPHFCGGYDPTPLYKSDGAGSLGKMPLTLAVPMAMIIERAPYGRDCQYGVVTVREGSSFSPYVGEVLGDISVGCPDMFGADMDRIFVADPDSPHKGVEYGIDFMGMTTDTEPRPSVAFWILSTGQIKQIDPSYEGRPASSFWGYSIPRGTNYALLRVVDAPLHPAEGDMPQIEAEIRELQDLSRNRSNFRDRVVVPLRAGVVSWETEGLSRGEGCFLTYPKTNGSNHNVRLPAMAIAASEGRIDGLRVEGRGTGE